MFRHSPMLADAGISLRDIVAWRRACVQRADRVLDEGHAVRLRVLAHDAARQGAEDWRAENLRVQVGVVRSGVELR